jgi:hypothetical protein
MTRSPVAHGLTVVTVLLLAVFVVGSTGERVRGASASDASPPATVPGEYIVVSDLPAAATEAAVEAVGAESIAVHELGPSFAVVSATAGEALAIDALPGVEGVYPNRLISLEDQQTNPPWGIDRVDQRSLPLDSRYRYSSGGAGVTAYVVDTGVRSDHLDFGGRVTAGYNAASSDPAGSDCSGHGTHVAGTIGGSYSGVAKSVTIVPVRVFACGVAQTPTSVIIAALAWIAADHDAGESAVANLSLGGPADAALDAAVNAVIADGVTVVVAAGNEATDACTVSPARVAGAVTVGAVDSSDLLASFSNRGSCVDLLAPGVSIVSSSYLAANGLRLMSGTSMASPHVAGAAALLLAEQPGLTPAQASATLTSRATSIAAGPLLFVPMRFALSVTRSGTGTGQVQSIPGTVSCGTQCTASFDADTSVQLMATPAQGSRFAGWGGACSGSVPSCSVTMGDTRSVTATFEPATCAAVSTADRVGFWKGSGSALSVSGPAVSGSVAYGDRVVGQGFVLSGSGLSSTDVATMTAGVSVMAWVRPVSTGGVQTLVSRSTGPGFRGVNDVSHGYALRLGPRGDVSWEVDDPSSMVPEVLNVPSSALFDGGWHHIAASWSPGSMAVFIDGVEVGRQVSWSASINAAASTAFMIGGEQGTPFGFTGSIDEPAVFSRVLSGAEIAAAYQASTAGLCT